MKDKKVIVIIILALLVVFALISYLILFSEKEGLIKSLSQLKGQLTVMEAENRSLFRALEEERQLRGQLNQEKVMLEQTVKAQEEKLASLADAAKTIDSLNTQIAALEYQARALREENANLKLQLAETARQNEALKARQGSIAELKKAIRELKRQVRQVKRQIREKSEDIAASGNRGFLIWDGKSTYPSRVRIEVNPAQ
jgi:chromosome segregation ATPase